METTANPSDGKPFRITTDRRESSVRYLYKVFGYWSLDYVSVCDSEGMSGERRIDVNYSGGGRDPEEEPDDLKAIENFAAALTDAVRRARQLKLEQTDTTK